ncbi:MAG TPA: GNAT family N-acetyltransferase [Ilumatobacter sp.]|nr:GNAT family N-acetyltransferase [Ilumatobacter sp.]
MSADEVGLRVERAWAATSVAHAEALARADATWGTDVFPVADGWAVLCGPGLFVNRVLAAGLAAPLAPAELDRFETRAGAAGVLPAFEVSELTRPDWTDELARRGYTADGSVTALARPLAEPAGTIHGAVVVEQLASDRVAEWQELSALGWGITVPAARRASDAFAVAAAAAGQSLLVARDADDGRPLGCAVLIVHDGVATLGGMSTLPTGRRRGVQSTLVTERLAIAYRAGCDLAATSAVTGGDSERNLERLGFTPTHTKRTLVLLPVVSTSSTTWSVPASGG